MPEDVQPATRPGHAVFRHAFVPVVLAALIASWMYHREIEGFLAARAITIDAMSAVLLTLIVCVSFAELAYPARREWNYRVFSDGVRGVVRLSRDLTYLFFVTQLTVILIKVTEARLKPAMTSVAHPMWPSQAPLAGRIVLAFFLVELCAYWIHRAAHRFPLLWRFHGTHHVITELSGLKSLRVHPVDNLVFYVARTVPLLFLGVGAEEIATATYLAGALGILSHANVNVSEGWLRLVVNYPRYHSVHHSADIAESNSNFGCHTVLWDRVFGTFRSAPGQPLTLGVTPVGPRSLWRELVRPFYRTTP